MTKLTQEDDGERKGEEKKCASLRSNLLAKGFFFNEQENYLLLYSSFHTPEHLDHSPPPPPQESCDIQLCEISDRFPQKKKKSRFVCFYDMGRLYVS